MTKRGRKTSKPPGKRGNADRYFDCNGMRKSGQGKKFREASYSPQGACAYLPETYTRTVCDAMSHHKMEHWLRPGLPIGSWSQCSACTNNQAKSSIGKI